MLTRRAFQGRLLASLGALALPRAAFATATSEATMDDIWLNRLTYGATPPLRDQIASMGRLPWFEAQLVLRADDPDVTRRVSDAKLQISYDAESDQEGHSWPALDELRGLAWLNANPADMLRLVDWSIGMSYAERVRPADEVMAATLIRAVHSPAHVHEVMVGFWHEHFSVNAQKHEYTAAFFPFHDQVLRTHALGNFRAMLGAVARDPSMLYYLNNDESRASPANENYARELLELHTLGAAAYLNDRHASWNDVPGAEAGAAEGYIDQDVYEVARAFTGWSVGDGRSISEGVEAPRSGVFNYVEAWHDPYQKRILGREFAPQRGPMEDGDEVLDLLSRHPATARFISEKLARRFLADTPPEDLVADLAQVFLTHADAPDQITHVLRRLVQSEVFSATPPEKVRRPFEFLTALYRATGANISGTSNAFVWQLSRAGWQVHTYGPPTGHPDTAGAWTGASTLNRLVGYALEGHEDWFGVARADFSALGPNESYRDFVARFAGALAPGRADDVVAALQDAYGYDPAAPVADLPDDDRKGLAKMAVAFAALTPDVLLR
jgi:uncharacterized protein (DUF1800 family)